MQENSLTPTKLLLGMVFIMAFGFSVWQVLLNNFVVERAHFTGVEIGLLQSIREIPGFLAFTVIYVLLFIKEQRLALLSLFVMAVGILFTGFFPSEYGLYITTLVMSIGFHYFETLNKSLTLQWVDKDKAPAFMGRALSIKAIASLFAYGLVWVLMSYFEVDYYWVYLAVGSLGVVAVVLLWQLFPAFNLGVPQKKTLFLRKRYWLYYVLVMLSGARRQIFVVFAGFMMVERFGYSVADISLLFIANYVFNVFFAEKIGRIIHVVGERNALVIEYLGLIVIFTGYAFVEDHRWAAALYILDHMFFALAIAISTYFQKIADKQDIAGTASVSFTINHIAAVVIPVILGMIWITSPTAVFLIGTALAVCSLVFTCLIPRHPTELHATVLQRH